MEDINIDRTKWNILHNDILYDNEVWGDLSPDLRLYFMLLDKVTELHEEDGVTYGIVLGGKRLSYRQFGAVLGLSWSCIRHCVARLRTRNLIRTTAGERRESLSYEVVNCRKPLREGADGAIRQNGHTYTRVSQSAVVDPAQERWQRLLDEYDKEDDPYAFDVAEFEKWALTDPEGKAWLAQHEAKPSFNVEGDDDDLA